METLYFSCRWEIPDNQVLLTKSWQQVEIIFHWQGDNGKKMAHTKFPIPLLSFLCPSNTRDFGRFGLQTECLSHFDKEKIIQNSELPERHYQSIEHYYFFTIPETQITLPSSFSFQNKNCYGSLFSSKESPWLYDRLKATVYILIIKCIHWQYHLSESMYVLIMFFVEIT